jgi:hypothetical protein
MRRLCTVALATILFVAPAARAGEGAMGGLGFRVGGSPFAGLLSAVALDVPQTSPAIGCRHWLNTQVGFDFGAGFNTFHRTEGTQEKRYTSYAFDAGLPISLKRWDKVSFIVRPGFQYGMLEEKDETSLPTVTTQWTMLGVTGEFEVEWMVADHVSLSAAHGLGWHTMEDDAAVQSKYTAFGSSSANFTELGFHVYLW